jgi:hypothetical protein
MDCIFVVMERLIAGRAEVDDRETGVSKTCVVTILSATIKEQVLSIGITDPRCNLG